MLSGSKRLTECHITLFNSSNVDTGDGGHAKEQVGRAVWEMGKEHCELFTENHSTKINSQSGYQKQKKGPPKITALRRAYLYKKRRHPAPFWIPLLLTNHPHFHTTTTENPDYKPLIRFLINTRPSLYQFCTMPTKKATTGAAKTKGAAAPVHGSYRGTHCRQCLPTSHLSHPFAPGFFVVASVC